MLCKKSAGRVVPAGSLSEQPVDTHHTGGTEGPETHKHINHENTNCTGELVEELNKHTKPADESIKPPFFSPIVEYLYYSNNYDHMLLSELQQFVI